MATKDYILVASSPNAEGASLRSELCSIEALLDDVLQRQSLLLSRLDALHPAPTPGVTDNAAQVPYSVVAAVNPPNTWTTVGARDGQQRCLPLFSPEDDDSLFPLPNFFALLETLRDTGLEVEPEVMHPPCDYTVKQPASTFL